MRLKTSNSVLAMARQAPRIFFPVSLTGFWAALEHSHPKFSLIPTLGDNSPLTHNGNALTQFSSFWNLSDPPLPLQDCLGEDD